MATLPPSSFLPQIKPALRQLAVGAHAGRARRKSCPQERTQSARSASFFVAVMEVEAEAFVDADGRRVVAMDVQGNRVDVAGEKLDEGPCHGRAIAAFAIVGMRGDGADDRNRILLGIDVAGGDRDEPRIGERTGDALEAECPFVKIRAGYAAR